MSESIIRVAGEPVAIADASLRLFHEMRGGRDYLSINLCATAVGSSDCYLAINSFEVAVCRSVADLEGRTFVLDSKGEDEPEGSRASGELMESVMGESDVDPLNFESISLSFGNVAEGRIPVGMVASVFDSARSGIPVEGNIIANCDEPA